MPTYSLVLTNRSWVPQGEIRNVSNFSYQRGLSKPATLGFQVRLDNPHVDRLSSVDGYVKMYRNGVLQFVGPIVTAEEKAERETRTLSINCSDAAWVLSKRFFGLNAAGYTNYATVATDRAVIAKAIIDAKNNDNEAGIRTTNLAVTSGSAITYKGGPYANAMTEIQNLGAALDGFDWIFRPIETWVNGAVVGSPVKWADFQANTIIGTNKPTAVFEYGVGTRSNVLNYTKTTTRDSQATRVYHLGSDASTVKTGINTAAETTWGWMQDVAQVDISDPTMRQKLVDEHVLVRGNPRTLIKMTPHIDPGVTGRLPQPFSDYDVGDSITARFIDNGRVRFSGLLRVYGINVTLDNGFERVELQLEDDA